MPLILDMHSSCTTMTKLWHRNMIRFYFTNISCLQRLNSNPCKGVWLRDGDAVGWPVAF